jgi:hypothetical protein
VLKTTNRKLGRSFCKEPAHDVAFPHPQTGKDHQGQEDVPDERRVVRQFLKRAIDVTDNRNADDEVNPRTIARLVDSFMVGFRF